MFIHKLGLLFLAFPPLVLSDTFLGDDCLSWQYGKGNGAAVENAGETETMAQCIYRVKEKFPEANGAFLENPSKASEGQEQFDCKAVVGQTGSDGDEKFINCFIHPASQKNYGSECIVAFEQSDAEIVDGNSYDLGTVDSMKTCINRAQTQKPFANAVVITTNGNSYTCKAVTGAVGGKNGYALSTTCLIQADPFIPNNGRHCSAYLTGKGNGQIQKLGTVNDMASCIQLVQAIDIKSNGATISNPQEANGPLECFAHLGQTKVDGNTRYVNCFIEPPSENEKNNGEDCIIYQEGQGIGGTAVQLDIRASMKDCVRQALIRVPYANGVTFSIINSVTGEGECEARISQTYVNKVANKANCFINPSYYKPDFGPLCKYFQRGSGVGGVENPLGMVNSMEECLKLSKEVDPTANGITMTDPDGNPPPYMCSQRVGQTYVKLTDRNKFVNCFTDSVDFLDTIKNITYSSECKLIFPGSLQSEQYRRKVGTVETMDECVKLARQYEPLANAVQMQNPKTYWGPLECWAGYETRKINANDQNKWMSCFIDPKPELVQLKRPHNCEYLQYGEASGKGNYVVGHTTTLEDCIDIVKEKAPFANGASLNKLDPLPAETKELWHDMFECVATIQQGYVKPDYDWENCFIEPVKENGKENGDDCLLFVDKATGSGSSTLVGAVADMKECVQLVKKEYPDAMGASMDHPLLSLPDFNCYAHLDHMDNTVGNTKMVVCWMRSPLSTKDGYSSCKVTMWGAPRGSNHYIDRAIDMNHCKRMVEASQYSETANAVYIRNPETYPTYTDYECYARVDSTGSSNANDKTWIGCYFDKNMDPVRPIELDSLPGAQYALFGYQQNGKSARSFKVKNLTECIEKARTSPGEPANQITMENPYIEKDTYNCWANGRATGVRYYEEKYVSIFIEPRKIWPEEENGDCVYRLNGAASGGKQKSVGNVASVEECVEKVKEADLNADSALLGDIWSRDGKYPCYAETGVTGVSANNNYMLCYFKNQGPKIRNGDQCMFYTEGYSKGGSVKVGEVNTMEECIELAKDKVTGKVPNAVSMSNPMNQPNPPYNCYRFTDSTGVSANSAYVTCMIQEEPEPRPWLSSSCRYLLVGDAFAGSEPYIGKAESFDDCYDMVTSKYPLANGLQMHNPDNYPTYKEYNCYAETNMKGVRNNGVSWVTCFIDENAEGVLAPGADCGYFSEDGNGNGKKQNLGTVSSMSACIRLIRKEVPGANGATMYSTGKGDASYYCIAETGQTGITSQKEYFNCFIDKSESSGVDPSEKFGPFGSKCTYFVFGHSPSASEKKKVSDARTMEQCIANVKDEYPQSLMAEFAAPQAGSDAECYAVLQGASPDGDKTWGSCYLTDEENNEAIDGLGEQCVFLQDGNGNGVKTKVGTIKKMCDCIDLVKYSGIAANGATIGAADATGHRDCFAELGQTGVKASRDFYNCFIRQENGEDKGHEDEIKVVDDDDPVIDSNEWYYEEYPSNQEGPGGEAGFWRLPKGVDASDAVKRATDTFFYYQKGQYWRQKLPGGEPLIVPGWNDDYDGVMQIPSEESCVVLDPEQWEFRDGTWKTKEGVILKQSTKDADCVQYVAGDPGYWIVDPDAGSPTFVPGSADFEDSDDKIPYYVIDDDKNIVIYEDDFYYDGEDWRLKPGVLPNNLDSDDFEFYEYPDGEVGKDGQTGYWRPKPGKNPIVVPDDDDDSDSDDGIIDQSGDSKNDEVVDIPVQCDDDPMSQNLVKIEVSGCRDSGHKDETRSCERMYDDNLSRVVDNGGCYVSSGWSNVWAELDLASTADVFQVTLSGKANGDKLPGTEVYVCSSDNDESCVYCTTIGETEKESCTRLGCESVITGNRVKLVGEKNGIVICDVSVMGIKRADQPGVEPAACASSDSNSNGEDSEDITVGALTVQSCDGSPQKQNNMKCDKMYDSKPGSCFQTKKSKNVFELLLLESQSNVHSVELVGADSGMKDVEVSVCSESGSCKLCGKVTSKDQKATINCPSPLAGIVVRLESANSNLQICEVTINGVKESGSGDCTAEIVEVGISEEELAENYAAKACEDNQGIMRMTSCSDSGTKDETRACENMFDDSIDTADGCYISKGTYKVWTEVKLESTGTITGFSLLGKPTGEKLAGAVVSVCYQQSCLVCTTIPNVASSACLTFQCDSPVEGDSIRFENEEDGLLICDLKVHGEPGEISIAPRVDKPEIAITSCADSGTSDISTSCQNMFDGDESRVIEDGGCYASKGSYKIWSELYLKKTSSVSEVYLLSRSSGSNLKGIVVEVCMDGKNNCETCGTVTDVAHNYTGVSCKNNIQGNVIRFTNPDERIVICEAKVY